MLKTTFKTFVCFILTFSLASLTFAGSTDGNAYGHLKAKLDAYFQQLVVDENFSGSVLVAKDGTVLLQTGYGMADYEKGIPNKANTVHAIASLSKGFTAMSILMLAERGLLNLDDPLSIYLPQVPNSGNIKIHHLLNHTSGLFNMTDNPLLWPKAGDFHYPLELLQYFIDEPVNFQPGTDWQYCNSGYVTLGIIIEQVSGMTYGEFIKENILEPLHMEHTSYDPYGNNFPNQAIGYDDITTNPPLLAFPLHPTVPFSAGAIYSTVQDLYKWDRALYTDQLVSSELMQQMFTPGLGDYGYGWYIDNLMVNGQPHKQIWHWGNYSGFFGFFSRLVDDNSTIILLRNTSPLTVSQDELRPIITAVAEIMFE
jgi:CubicO group peptidase (beta-lactamase class C family)